MLLFILIISIIIPTATHVCQELSQYSSCSPNPSCKCLKLAANITAGICASLYVTCSELSSCFGENQICFQPNHICVRHPRCQTQPICYPEYMTTDALCPSIPATTSTPLPDGICAQAVWSRNGVTVAGGNGRGGELNQLDFATGLFIDEDGGSIYVADQSNNRVIKWNSSETSSLSHGVIVADGKGIEDGVFNPIDVVIDNSGTMYICDYGSRRIIRWLSAASNGDTFISNISCSEHRVVRWDIRATASGKVVAGGNGKGSNLNQLNQPYYSFIDQDRSVYVADHLNNRIVKWIENAQEGVLIAGTNESDSETNQLSLPTSIVVDQMGSVYVTDTENTRVVRYLSGGKDGTVIIGGNESGDAPDQLNEPFDMAFDRNGNLYVVDLSNYRIQMFKIDKSPCSKFDS